MESLKEAKLSYTQKDEFKRMFDALQEGIIVLSDNKLDFMNDLSNKILTALSGLKSFKKNKYKIG